MKRLLATLLILLAANAYGQGNKPNTNPNVGDLWTYFGPTFGAGWGNIPIIPPAPFTNITLSGNTTATNSNCLTNYYSNLGSQITFTFSGTFTAGCQIRISNQGSRAIRVQNVGAIGGFGGTSFWIWPFNSCNFLAFPSGTIYAFDCPKLYQVPAGFTFYIDPNFGNDTTSDGLAPGTGAFRTIQNGIKYCQNYIFALGGGCTITAAQGIYNEALTQFGEGSGQWEGITILGAQTGLLSDVALWVLNVPQNLFAVTTRDKAILTIRGFTFIGDPTGPSSGLSSTQLSVIDAVDVAFQNFPGGTLAVAGDNGAIGFGGTTWIQGNAAVGFGVTNASHMTFGSSLIVTQAVNIPIFVQISDGGFFGSEGGTGIFNANNVNGIPYQCWNGGHFSRLGATWPGNGVGQGWGGCFLDSDRQAAAFRARMSVNQGIADSTTTVLSFNVGSDLNQGFYNATNFAYTPPAGSVHMECHAFWSNGLGTDPVANDIYIIFITKNGVPLSGHQVTVSGTAGAGGGLSLTDHALGNDIYQCSVNLQHGSGTHTIQAGPYTYFSGSQ